MTQTAQPLSPQAGDLWPVTREIYASMVDAGIFHCEKVELIRGRIIQMPPMGLPHGLSLIKSTEAIRGVFPPARFTVRSQMQFEAADASNPEPDICVVEGKPGTTAAHPTSALLVIEISETSLAYDRNEKGPLYAESGVQDYWIINLADSVIEIYRNPHPIAGGGHAYNPAIIKRPGELFDPLASPRAMIDPKDLLP